jgi:hypothetical protein
MKARHTLAAVALSASLAACGDSSSTTAQAADRPSVAPGITTSAPADASTAGSAATPGSAGTAGGSVAAFCAGAHRLGLEQKPNLSDGSPGVDPSLLPELDALSARAPAQIAPDFALFVKLEHAVLGRTPDPADLQEIDSPATESRLANVSTYLAQHCGTG